MSTMVRTQIQLPDVLYRQLKSLAEAQEWSLAETLRRGAELLLRSYPTIARPAEPWAWPVLALGAPMVPDESLRELANARDLDA